MSSVCPDCGVVHEEDDIESSWHYWAKYTKDKTLKTIEDNYKPKPASLKNFSKTFLVTATTRFVMDEDMSREVNKYIAMVDGPLVKICFILDGLPMTSMCVVGNKIEDDEWAYDLTDLGIKEFMEFVLGSERHREIILGLRTLN